MKTIVKTFSELTNVELYDILALRSEVFIVEQRSIEQDMDGVDKECYHVYITKNDKIVAYARVIDKFKRLNEVSIGRVVTDESVRGLGLGYKVMELSIEIAKEKYNAKKILVDAQYYAKKFYEKLGFKQITEVEVDNGIEHILMQLDV
jgi:ElaA protein